MRADVAAILHEDAAEIGDHDNLMDLGLDSMRAMNLIVRWSEAGVTFEFADLAQHTTLAGWWSVVQARQAKTP
jgi:aryl carrier-like protein